jgi:hypothetical protein
MKNVLLEALIEKYFLVKEINVPEMKKTLQGEKVLNEQQTTMEIA